MCALGAIKGTDNVLPAKDGPHCMSWELLLSERRTVVKCICESNQSRHWVVFYPEPVAMSTTFSGWRSVFCNLGALLLLSHLTFKDVRGWQFLTMKAAETLCIVCLPPEKHIS